MDKLKASKRKERAEINELEKRKLIDITESWFFGGKINKINNPVVGEAARI